MAKSLARLESVANFTEFVKAFSVFGAEMVELAHVTGNVHIHKDARSHTHKNPSAYPADMMECLPCACLRVRALLPGTFSRRTRNFIT